MVTPTSIPQSKILYPRHKEVFPRGSFFAIGRAPKHSINLIGRLLKHDLPVATGKLLCPPTATGKWIMHFKLDSFEIDQAIYSLALFDGILPLDVVRDLSFHPTHGVFITYPDNNEDCCSDFFFALGVLTASDLTITSATMTRADALGDPIESNAPIVEAGDWFADWDVLSESDTELYRLRVSGNGGGAAQKIDLHLLQIHCS